MFPPFRPGGFGWFRISSRLRGWIWIIIDLSIYIQIHLPVHEDIIYKESVREPIDGGLFATLRRREDGRKGGIPPLGS